MLISFNRIDQAITQLRATLVADPKDAMSWLNLGLLFENKMSGVLDEVRKIQDKSTKLSEAKRKIAAQKDQVDVYNDEVKRTKAKLKTTPPAQAEAEVGDEAANKAKIEELSAKVAEFRKDLPGYYTKALEIDGNYYDALYQLGAYYFNEAVEIKKKVDNMDMDTYKKEGKVVEAAVTAKYEQALPYFEKGYKAKKEEDLKEVLKQIYRALKMDAKLTELDK
jgi:hypothetical protein